MRSEAKSAATPRAFAVALLLTLALLAVPLAPAQSFSVVHNFTGGNGGVPYNGLIAVGSGGGGSNNSTSHSKKGTSFYGTTSTGGANGYGVLFSLTPSGTETIVHNFAGGADGANPWGLLITDKASNLYGTTTAGGTSNTGTVFEVSGTTETVLYSFAGGRDGAAPEAGLVMDAAGNLYGTTSAGGSSGNGTVFELVAPKTKGGQWTESVLYSFGTGTDGSAPVGGVSFDSAGNLYGTTSAGGNAGYGIVFQLVAGSWNENILHNFQNGNDGSVPYAGLISDASGNFYGATTQGGSGGGGTVFELTSSGGTWTFNTVYGVSGWGISGTFRNLVLDGAGNLYGTTHCDGSYNAGTVFQLKPSSGGKWTYNQLYTFTGGSDGQYSVSNLVLNQNKLYGTTLYGGSNGNGVVYEVTP